MLIRRSLGKPCMTGRRQLQQDNDDQFNLDMTELKIAIVELEIVAKHEQEDEEIGPC